MVDQPFNGKEASASSAPGAGAARDEANAMLQTHASLARQERTAALRVLTGRVAHQMRNPLAAIQAACSSLRMELPDPDHRERLDLILHEVARVLALISAEIQAFARPSQTAQEVDVVAETAQIVALVGGANPHAARASLRAGGAVSCMAVPADLRIALFSLLGHAIERPGVRAVEIGIDAQGTRAQIAFRLIPADGADLQAALPSIGESHILPDDIGLLIAERLARDLGGRLIRQSADGTSQLITLELPCADV